MSKRLVALNVGVGLVGLFLAGFIAREMAAPVRPPAVPRSAPVAAPAAGPADAAGPAPPPGAWNVVASRNLFSPTRTETAPTATSAAQQVPKPHLYGVVVRDGTPLAYLEDPVTKRVAGYRIGDAIAGGTLQSIAPDRVVLDRPEGPVDVRLHDPSKPKPAAAPPGAGQPTAAGQPPTPPGGPRIRPQLPIPPPTPGSPVPPALLRRPAAPPTPSAPNDATRR